jgi:hypothetical protein
MVNSESPNGTRFVAVFPWIGIGAVACTSWSADGDRPR